MPIPTSSTGSPRSRATGPDFKVPLSGVIDAILGRPFVWLGRGPAAFDCLGLLVYLLDQVAGIQIEDPREAAARTSSIEALLQFHEHFIRLPTLTDLEPLDVLYWRQGGGDSHLAVVENERWTVNAELGAGVQRRRLLDHVRRAEAAYRLKALL